MLTDKQLIQLMVNEPSWEDVIVKIVAEEGMDPWKIDLIRLADAFTDYLARMERTDLRVPARFILIAAILLRMKSDILIEKKRKLFLPESEKPLSPILQALAKVPPLEPPIKRMPLATVSVEELLTALKKAFEVKERRIERRARVRRRVREAVPPAEEDISERIDRLLSHIEDIMKDIEGSVEFSKLLSRWEREDIVKTLVPMLHLSQEGKIIYEQPELFKEIYVKLRKEEENEEKEQEGNA